MHVERDSEEWRRMWSVIAARYGDTSCECTETGERWQYMGTHDGVHQFRHRSFEGKRCYANVPASTQ